MARKHLLGRDNRIENEVSLSQKATQSHVRALLVVRSIDVECRAISIRKREPDEGLSALVRTCEHGCTTSSNHKQRRCATPISCFRSSTPHGVVPHALVTGKNIFIHGSRRDLRSFGHLNDHPSHQQGPSRSFSEVLHGASYMTVYSSRPLPRNIP